MRGEAVDFTLTCSPQFISHGSASKVKEGKKKKRIDTEDYKEKMRNKQQEAKKKKKN